MEQTLQFSASLPGHDDRARLLNDAAGMLDRRSSLLGPDGAPAETEEGRLARMFAQDQAQLGRPQVLRLAPDGLGAIGDGVPVEVAELARRNAHYWLTFPVSLWTSANRGFNRIEFKATFSAADGDSARAPATVDAVPSQELVTRFEANTEVSLTVGADFGIKANLPAAAMAALGVPLPVTAGAQATAGGQTKVVFAPPSYTIRAARVARSGVGFDHVFWRIDRDAFVQENDPGLRVILRLPLPASHLTVGAQMVVTRYANLFGAGFRRAIGDLPAALRDFFTGGTPIAATAEWDLSGEL